MRGTAIMAPKSNGTHIGSRKETEKELSQRFLLTLEEAARHTGIGINKLREISSQENCDFVLWNTNLKEGERLYIGDNHPGKRANQFIIC